MKLISKIRVEGFRSIKDTKNTLDNFENNNIFVGLNNSGKSNLLRALNLFFNGRIDETTEVDVDRDYYRHELRKRRKKKYIQISVTFKIPELFKFPKTLKPMEGFLRKEFTIIKRWERGGVINTYLNPGDIKTTPAKKQKIEQFLSLINFRYIPNRVSPVDLIKKEYPSLRDVIIRRLGKKGKESHQSFDLGL